MAEKDVDTPDEFIEIAADISQCNYNVKQFKKSRLNKHLKPSRNGRNNAITRLNTEPSHCTLKQSQDLSMSSIKSKTMTEGLNRSLRFNSTFIHPQSQNKKPFFSKSNNLINEATVGSSGFGRYRSEDKNKQSRQSNKLHTFQQKWSKEKLNEKSLEGWLNSIVIQFCHNQYFDHKIANCALKKLGIDQNSLVAKGLKPSNVSRLYRSLFVFGMGFNEFTRQLANGNVEIAKIIWKIYSIVLEYCSKGNLQAVIGEIQRENELKVTELTGQLERKQQIIDKNEELNEKRNIEIYKEIKSLRQENVNLKNEKTVLLDEYSATEQAFGEQINLRMKFQTKINQIYGLHRQLGMKHQKMHHELVRKVEELKNESQRYFQAVEKISEFREIQANLRQQLVQKKEKEKRYAEHLSEANRQIIFLSTKISTLQHEVDSLKTLYKDVKVKEKQLLIEKANMEAIVEMREKSAKETFKEYQITLEENNRLYIMISDQRKTMEDYEKDKKNFNSKIISIVADNSFNKRKLEEMTKKCEEAQTKYAQLQLTVTQVQEENEILRKNENSYMGHFDSVQEKIQEMHKLNMSQSEELSNLRVFQQGSDKLFSQKNKQLEKLKKETQKKEQMLEELKAKCLDLESKYALLNDKLIQAQNNVLLKQAKLLRAQQENEEKNIHLIKTNGEQAAELEKIKAQFQIIMREFKNQKFERSSLNTMYVQVLKTIESKNNEQRSLRVKVSLLEGELSKQKSNYKILETSMLRLISNFGLVQEKLEETLQKQRQKIYQKAQYVHPMIIQDLHVRVCDLQNTKQQKQEQIDFLKIKLQKERALAKQQLETTSSTLRWEISRIKVENERTVEALNNQIIYAKEQWAKQKKSLEQLEAVAESYKKKIYEKTTSEREEVYKFMLQEKAKQIDKMFKEMETLQDQLTALKRRLAEEAIAREQEILASQDQLKNIIEQSVRKELSHEYDLKLRQTQRSMRADYNKKQNQTKLDLQNCIRDMPMEQILKIKNTSWEQLKGMPSNRVKFNRNIFDYQRDDQGPFQKSKSKGQNQPQVQKRGQMGRLMKNAYQYYQP